MGGMTWLKPSGVPESPGDLAAWLAHIFGTKFDSSIVPFWPVSIASIAPSVWSPAPCRSIPSMVSSTVRSRSCAAQPLHHITVTHSWQHLEIVTQYNSNHHVQVYFALFSLDNWNVDGENLCSDFIYSNRVPLSRSWCVPDLPVGTNLTTVNSSKSLGSTWLPTILVARRLRWCVAAVLKYDPLVNRINQLIMDGVTWKNAHFKNYPNHRPLFVVPLSPCVIPLWMFVITINGYLLSPYLPPLSTIVIIKRADTSRIHWSLHPWLCKKNYNKCHTLITCTVYLLKLYYITSID